MGAPKANTTVTYAFSAAGDYVEPLITLKDSNSSVAEIAFALGSVGANYGINQTESGWTKTESFYYFVSMHLHNQWEQKNCPKPRILTIDGYGAHLSPKLFRWCRRNAVILIVLYPGATPYMQMCDTTMFSPMKRKHEQLYSQWRLKNPTKTMNDVEFVKILKQINDEVIKKESIINGWRATGLQPFNFNNLNTAGLLSKSLNRNYDFKGFCIDPTLESSVDTISDQPNVNVLSDIILDPSSEHYIQLDELSSLINSEGNASNGRDNDSFNLYMEVDPVDDVRQLSGFEQHTTNQVLELVDINMEDIPEGPLLSAEGQSLNSQEHSNQSLKNDLDASTAIKDQCPINNSVAFSEVAGPNEFLKSQSEMRFDLTAFGIPTTGVSNTENASKVGTLVEKIRRDVKQLGILCAASDKDKLINILIINQQLNAIDPPQVEETITTEENRTIKSILKAPTMPQRINKKRNMNLKVSYGVVTAKEVVQSIMEREVAEQQHEIEREKDEVAKITRENEISAVEDELKVLRKLLGSIRSELVALNKEMIQKKKSKAVSKKDLKLNEESKREKERQIKDYDEQLKELREKLKNLKTIHVETNKAVSQKRKTFELQKKEIGNKVQPPNTPQEIDETDELDVEPF